MLAKPYAVVCSKVIAALPAEVRALVADLREWNLWSPWEARDPYLNRRFSEPSSGAGAWFEWDGNLRAGAGRIEILQASDDAISLNVVWHRPFRGEQQMEFRLDPCGSGTRITWTMHGEISGAARLAAFIFPMSRIHGPTFERGLARLKSVSER